MQPNTENGKSAIHFWIWMALVGAVEFGFAWLVKGETLFKDAATPDQAGPVEAIPAQAVPVDATAAGGAAGVIYQTENAASAPPPPLT